MAQIQSLPEEQCNLALRTIAWVSHVVHPLQVEALQHAFAVEVGDEEFDHDGITSPQRIIKLCRGLVEIQSNEVKLSHHTVKEYFTRVNEPWFIGADEDIARTSIAYLSLKNFENPCDDVELSSRLREFPYLSYAAFKFGLHASSCPDIDSAIQEMCTDFINLTGVQAMPQGSVQMAATRVSYFIEPVQGKSIQYPPLHMAIVCGLWKVVEGLLDKGAHIDTLGPGLQTPLHMAARSSDPRIVRMLLERGADINATNYYSRSALDLVMFNPFQILSSSLLGQIDDDIMGMFLPKITEIYRAKQLAAIDSGKVPEEFHLKLNITTMREIFLQLTTDSTEPENSNDTGSFRLALWLDAKLAINISQDEEEIVELLIDHGIDVNSQTCGYMTALHIAALNERPKLTQYLLKKGANPFLKRRLECTALDIAIRRGSNKVVELLSHAMENLEKQEADATGMEAKLSKGKELILKMGY